MFLFVFGAIFIVLAIVENNNSAYNSAAAQQYANAHPGAQIDGNIHVSDPLVFRGGRSIAQCTAGEHWDPELQLCAPNMHTPSSFEPLIVNGSVPVCDSFFGSMCGKWAALHTNQDRSFTYGYMRNQHWVKRSILKDTNAPVHRFYDSCMQHHYDYVQDIESRMELKHQLESVVGDFQSIAELPIVLGRLARRGFEGSVIALSIERHPTKPELLPLIMWDGLRNLPQSTVEYLLRETRTVTQLTTLQMMDMVTRVMHVTRALQEHNEGHFLEDITDYVHYVQHNFSTVPYSELGSSRKQWLETYWQSMGGASLRFSQRQRMWVPCKDYLKWIMDDSLLDVNDWKAYLKFVVIYNVHEFVPELPDNAYYRHWDEFGPVGKRAALYHRVKRGGTPMRRRRRREASMVDCLRVTQAMVPGLVARAFMDETHLREQDMDEVRDMVERVLRVYERGVRDNTHWLSGAGKEAALRKLQNVVIRVGEPDTWEVEPFADILSADRYTHNLGLVRRYRVQRNLQLWARPFDRNALAYFGMPLTEVNAYYSGPSNTITVLAGIMLHPFYNPEYNQVSKHAILGSIIGHELGHVLDFHGLRWDEQGSMTEVYGPEDMQKFTNLTQCVVQQYSHSTKHCNATLIAAYGNHTMNENMADLIGVHLAYGAYFDETPQGRAAPMGDRQYFFMSFAQAWCSSYDTEHMCDRMENDVHAIAEYRVDYTLRNTAEFHRVFGCHPGQGMFKSKADQCSIYAL